MSKGTETWFANPACPLTWRFRGHQLVVRRDYPPVPTRHPEKTTYTRTGGSGSKYVDSFRFPISICACEFNYRTGGYPTVDEFSKGVMHLPLFRPLTGNNEHKPHRRQTRCTDFLVPVPMVRNAVDVTEQAQLHLAQRAKATKSNRRRTTRTGR